MLYPNVFATSEIAHDQDTPRLLVCSKQAGYELPDHSALCYHPLECLCRKIYILSRAIAWSHGDIRFAE